MYLQAKYVYLIDLPWTINKINYCEIYQNDTVPFPYFWPVPKIDTLFQTRSFSGNNFVLKNDIWKDLWIPDIDNIILQKRQMKTIIIIEIVLCKNYKKCSQQATPYQTKTAQAPLITLAKLVSRIWFIKSLRWYLRSHLSAAVFRQEYINTIVTSHSLCFI